MYRSEPKWVVALSNAEKNVIWFDTINEAIKFAEIIGVNKDAVRKSFVNVEYFYKSQWIYNGKSFMSYEYDCCLTNAFNADEYIAHNSHKAKFVRGEFVRCGRFWQSWLVGAKSENTIAWDQFDPMFVFDNHLEGYHDWNDKCVLDASICWWDDVVSFTNHEEYLAFISTNNFPTMMHRTAVIDGYSIIHKDSWKVINWNNYPTFAEYDAMWKPAVKNVDIDNRFDHGVFESLDDDDVDYSDDGLYYELDENDYIPF